MFKIDVLKIYDENGSADEGACFKLCDESNRQMRGRA